MTRQPVVFELISDTSALVIEGEHVVRGACRRLDIRSMRDVKTKLWWVPARRVDDIAALLESRRHRVEIKQVLR